MPRLLGGTLLPRLVLPPPGPVSRRLSARLAACEAPGIDTLGPADEPSVVWDEALGANVLDVDGNLYLDLTSGFGAAAVGHRHPRVVAAVVEQAGRLLHGLGDVAAHPARVELACRLAALAPVDEARVHFAVSGSDAVEIALETALASTGRAGVLAFDPAYHGVSLGALAATSRTEFREPFAAYLHPHVVRLPFGVDLDRVEQALAANPVGAVLVEPLVGREGVLVPPAGWLRDLAVRARAHGALFVADEILTGGGRTGAFFASEQEGVRPDLLCCGKALGGGLPLAAVVGRRALMEVWRTSGEALHTGTFVAHPLACAAALATLAVLEEEHLVERARRGAALVERHLAPLAAESLRVVAVRGRGLLWGIEVADAATARAVVLTCRDRGVLVLAGGPGQRVLEVLPPLTISELQLEHALAVLAAAVRESAHA